MLITTCPQCRAKFRVTEQHLSAADGLVVCSRCRGIFQAKDSLQHTTDTGSKPPERPSTKLSAHLFGSTIRSGRRAANEFDLGDLSESPTPSVQTSATVAEIATENPHSPNDKATHLTTTEASKPSLFTRIFSKKKTPQPTDTVKNTTETVASQQPETTPPTTAQINHPTEPITTNTTTAQEEFSAVPEPKPEQTALLEDKSNEQQTYLPGIHLGEMPAPYDPRFDPRFYPPPPTREEMNWTMASIVALIVLVIQLFYIILQR